MIRFTSVFYSPGEGGGGGNAGADGGAPGADGGAPGSEGAVAESWHSQSEYLKANPDAAKAFSKYKSSDEALKAGHEAIKLVHGTPYRLPKDHAKLSDDNKAEINAFVNKMRGVPDAPEGYEFELPDDVPIDDQGMADFRKLAHERGVDGKTAQDLLGIQIGLVNRLNAHRNKVIQGMTDNNYKTFLNEDCEGDKEVAASRLENVKKYLQTFCTGKDGEPDAKAWEAFSARIMHGDRMIELPLLRAIHEAAQAKMGTGGAPGGSSAAALPPGVFSYSEMGKK